MKVKVKKPQTKIVKKTMAIVLSLLLFSFVFPAVGFGQEYKQGGSGMPGVVVPTSENEVELGSSPRRLTEVAGKVVKFGVSAAKNAANSAKRLADVAVNAAKSGVSAVQEYWASIPETARSSDGNRTTERQVVIKPVLIKEEEKVDSSIETKVAGGPNPTTISKALEKNQTAKGQDKDLTVVAGKDSFVSRPGLNNEEAFKKFEQKQEKQRRRVENSFTDDSQIKKGFERLEGKENVRLQRDDAQPIIPQEDRIKDLADGAFDNDGNVLSNPIVGLEERVNPTVNAQASPAFSRLTQPPNKFRRLADSSRINREMSRRLTGEIKPYFVRLSERSSRVVRFSPKLIDTSLDPGLSKLANVSDKIEGRYLRSQAFSQVNNKFEGLADVSANKLNVQFPAKGVKIAPQLLKLSSISSKFGDRLPQAKPISSQVNFNLRRLATISVDKFNMQSQAKKVKISSQFEALEEVSFGAASLALAAKAYQVSAALKGLDRLLPESKVSPRFSRLSQGFRIANFEAKNGQIDKFKQLKNPFLELASLPKENSKFWSNSEKILLGETTSSAKKIPSLNTMISRAPIHMVEGPKPKLPKVGFIRFLHGDKGRRSSAIQALELSGIDAQDMLILREQLGQQDRLLIAESLQTINSPALHSLEPADVDGKMTDVLNSILFSSDVITRQLIVRSVR